MVNWDFCACLLKNSFDSSPSILFQLQLLWYHAQNISEKLQHVRITLERWTHILVVPPLGCFLIFVEQMVHLWTIPPFSPSVTSLNISIHWCSFPPSGWFWTCSSSRKLSHWITKCTECRRKIVGYFFRKFVSNREIICVRFLRQTLKHNSNKLQWFQKYYLFHFQFASTIQSHETLFAEQFEGQHSK